MPSKAYCSIEICSPDELAEPLGGSTHSLGWFLGKKSDCNLTCLGPLGILVVLRIKRVCGREVEMCESGSVFAFDTSSLLQISFPGDPIDTGPLTVERWMRVSPPPKWMLRASSSQVLAAPPQARARQEKGECPVASTCTPDANP